VFEWILDRLTESTDTFVALVSNSSISFRKFLAPEPTKSGPVSIIEVKLASQNEANSSLLFIRFDPAAVPLHVVKKYLRLVQLVAARRQR
jgi:hypothetical protein